MAFKLYPIAVSSQLDHTGRERIHAANKETVARGSYTPPPVVYYLVASGQTSDSRLFVYSLEDSVLTEIVDTQVNSSTITSIDSASFSPDSSVIVTGTSYLPGQNLKVYSFDGTVVSPLANPVVDFPTFSYGAFSPDGNWFAAVGQEGGIMLYAHDGAGLLTHEGTLAFGKAVIGRKISWHPDSQHFAVCGLSGSMDAIPALVVVDVNAGAPAIVWSVPVVLTENSSVTNCDFSPDGNYLVFCGESATGSPLRKTNIYQYNGGGSFTFLSYLTALGGFKLEAISFSPDGTVMVVAIDDNPTALRCFLHDGSGGLTAGPAMPQISDFTLGAEFNATGEYLAVREYDNNAALYLYTHAGAGVFSNVQGPLATGQLFNTCGMGWA